MSVMNRVDKILELVLPKQQRGIVLEGFCIRSLVIAWFCCHLKSAGVGWGVTCCTQFAHNGSSNLSQLFAPRHLQRHLDQALQGAGQSIVRGWMEGAQQSLDYSPTGRRCRLCDAYLWVESERVNASIAPHSANCQTLEWWANHLSCRFTECRHKQ